MRYRSLRSVIAVLLMLAAGSVTSGGASATPADTDPAAASVGLQPGQDLQGAVFNRASGKCLSTFSSAAGAPVWLSDCGSYGWNVQWEIKWQGNAVYLRKPGTDMCLVAPYWSGYQAVLHHCGFDDQLWVPQDVGWPWFMGRNVAQTGNCLVGPHPNWSNDRPVSWACHTEFLDQHWSVALS